MSATQRYELRSKAHPSETAHTAQQLFYEIKSRILASTGPLYFQYNVPDPSIGLLVSESLDSDGEIERRSVHLSYNSVTRILSVKLPIGFQNSHIAWAGREFALSLISGFFTLEEYDGFIFSSNSSFENFLPPYENSLKQPDAYFKIPGSRHPTVVFVAGYSESYPQLMCDRDIWIDAPPPGAPAQEITLYRGDLYPSGQVPSGRNSSDTWQWPLDSLRTRAARMIQDCGYVPA
ncbi:hypothetical protein DTO271G3_2326 [Paecilomyces variotii]|nr:hypothetical protein DTO271G3_2326 [Paecilomyces variotii]